VKDIALAQQQLQLNLDIQREPVKNSFADCHEPCGGAGLCHTFCGHGNACCRKSGDILVPDECRGVQIFWTPHYECVAPVRPAFDRVELGAIPEEMAAGTPEDPKSLSYGFFFAGVFFLFGIAGLYYMAGEATKHDQADLLRSVSQALEPQQQAAVFDRAATTPSYLPVEPTAGFLSAPEASFSHGPTLLNSGPMGVKKPASDAVASAHQLGNARADDNESRHAVPECGL